MIIIVNNCENVLLEPKLLPSELHHPGLAIWPYVIGIAGIFLPIFSGIIIFSIDSYYWNLSCSKCIAKSFVIYPDNVLQTYTYNSPMTFQSGISSDVIEIAGILVCIVIRLPTGLPPTPWSSVLYFSICEYFEKLTS